MHFPLFHSHLDLAHRYWSLLVNPGDIVVDATCGNGKDTLFLSRLDSGRVYALDIQMDAINSARQYLADNLLPEQMKKVEFILGCHSRFPAEIEPGSCKLIVYNLGYLPGGNKELTTFADTTVQSLHAALGLVTPGGAISVTCYPGHLAGEVEEERVIDFAAGLPKEEWNCCYHRWPNRLKSPTLILLQRKQ